MRFIVINPKDKTVRAIDASSFDVALDVAGLGDVDRDHGLVDRGIGIVVFEYGLHAPPNEQSYFAINGKLYAGNALLYGFDSAGETIDITRYPEPIFFKSVAEIEAAIYEEKIARPMQILNNEVIWQWPNPMPPS